MTDMTTEQAASRIAVIGAEGMGTAGPAVQMSPGENDFDFYRCARCRRLITRVEELMAKQGRYGGAICRCGSFRFSPVNMRWFHWFLPRVWIFAALRLAKKV